MIQPPHLTGERVLEPGDLVTVPAGVAHLTSPAGDRSVNITVVHAALETVWLESSLSAE